MSRRKKRASEISGNISETSGSSVRLKLAGPFILLFFTTLLWHGLLLTNDGTIWDSWYVLGWLQNRNWRALHEFFDSVGMPVYGWLYRPFAFAPDIVGAFMAATFLCLFAQSALTYVLARRLGGLNSSEALCLALLAQAIPVFTAGQDFIMFFFVFMHTVFLLAAWLASLASVSSGRKQMVLNLSSVVLFLVCFYNAALLVFYAGFFILLFVQYTRGLSFWTGVLRFARARWYFLILPPVAWMLRHRLTPQFGWYETYNSPVENIPLIIPSLLTFFTNVVPFHFMQLGRWVSGNLPVVFALIACVFVWVKFGPKSWSVKKGGAGTPAMIAFGVLLLFLAIFPFSAAGKFFSPSPVGEPSRYTILTGLPLAILLFGIIRLLFLRRPGDCSRLVGPLTAACAVVLGCQIPPAYVAERADWIFNRSALANAAGNEEIRKSSVVVFQNFSMTNEIVYGIYAFASAFGDTSRLVTNQVPQNRQYFTPSEIAMTLLRTTNLPNTLNRVDPSGQQTLLVANRNRGGLTDWELIRKYLSLRYFGSAVEMDAFLSALTSLQTAVLKPSTPLLPALPGIEPSPSVPEESGDQPFRNSANMKMMPVPGGWWAAAHETTQAQFEAVMKTNPSLFKDPLRPVERVSWNEANEFCKRLTESEHKAGRVPSGYSYRLPTVGEFEQLAKGTSDAVLAGNEMYWHTQPVGSLAPNPCGLFDVVGNVWEWTDDWADKGHRMKYSMGGAWDNYEQELSPYPGKTDKMDFFSRTIAQRLFGPLRRDYPDQAFWDRGFRCVLAKKNDVN